MHFRNRMKAPAGAFILREILAQLTQITPEPGICKPLQGHRLHSLQKQNNPVSLLFSISLCTEKVNKKKNAIDIQHRKC